MTLVIAIFIAVVAAAFYILVVWKPLFHDPHKARTTRPEDVERSASLQHELSERIEELQQDLAAGKVSSEEYEKAVEELRQYYNTL